MISQCLHPYIPPLYIITGQINIPFSYCAIYQYENPYNVRQATEEISVQKKSLVIIKIEFIYNKMLEFLIFQNC